MKTITQSHTICGVIPSFILSRIGNTGDPSAGDDARATLEAMRELANEQALTLIDQAIPRRTEPRKSRNIYDAGGGHVLRGKLVLSDHRSADPDAEAREVFEALGAIWDFFHRVYGCNSIDGRGFPLNATVHFGTCFHNAMWNGDQIVFGDGDGRTFKRFITLDVIAHEWMHGMIQCHTGIGYTGEAGAVNESLADVLASVVKQYKLGQTVEQADWLIGEGMFGPAVNGRGIRSLAAPGQAYDDPVLGRDPQPAHLRDYVETEEDNGGVHINSGIPNHAFYRAAMAIGGASWEVAGRIWYHAMINGLPNEPTLFDLAAATVDAAGDFYGYGSAFQRIVVDAWAGVGLVVPLVDPIRMATQPIPGQPLVAMPRPSWRPRASR